MAISDTQKVDLLWKKIGFSKTKSDTNANKKAANEAIVSELIIKPSNIWSDGDNIPGTQPAANTTILRIYTEFETTEDSTATNNRTWKTGATNWVPPSFGNPQSCDDADGTLFLPLKEVASTEADITIDMAAAHAEGLKV